MNEIGMNFYWRLEGGILIRSGLKMSCIFGQMGIAGHLNFVIIFSPFFKFKTYFVEYIKIFGTHH
jgi:hypothetical protein